jgi:putative membrane protein
MTGGLINAGYILNAIIFSFIGLVIFTTGFWVFDRVTPYHLWKEIIEEQNMALAIVVAGISLGICSIIAAAIHG